LTVPTGESALNTAIILKIRDRLSRSQAIYNVYPILHGWFAVIGLRIRKIQVKVFRGSQDADGRMGSGSKPYPNHYYQAVTPKKKRTRNDAFPLPQNENYNPVNWG